MKNFHSSLYEDIKEQVTMAQVLEGYGIPVRKHLAVCPFHNDKKPSMRVYDNSFYCFACGTGGDVVKFVALYLNISNFEAAKTLAAEYGISAGEPITSSSYSKIARKQIEENKAKAFEKWINNTKSLLADYHRILYRKIHKDISSELTDEMVNTMLELNNICDMLEQLDTDNMNELIEFYSQYKEEVVRIERRVRNT